MIYIASPYTHKDESVIAERYNLVEKFTAHMLNKNLAVYSPIVHCHYIAKNHKLPTDFNFWKTYNIAMLSSATELYVLRLKDWEKSVGVAAEIQYAINNSIKVSYFDPV